MIYIHNLLTTTVATEWGGQLFLAIMRDILWACGWNENSNDGSPVWTGTNITVPESGEPLGYSVSADSPMIITSPTAVFTQAMQDERHMISLRSEVNDENCGMYRIASFIDANTIRIAAEQWNDFIGWITETGITGRIICPNKQKLPTTAWVIMDSPGGDAQIKFNADSTNDAYASLIPKGQIADPTATTAIKIADDYSHTLRMNVQVNRASNEVYLFALDDYGYNMFFHVFDLTQPDGSALTGDSHPTLMMCSYSTTTIYAWKKIIYGIDHIGAVQQLYLIQPKRFSNLDSDDGAFEIRRKAFINGDKIQLIAPYAIVSDSATGAYVRGRVPDTITRISSAWLPYYSRLGDGWLHLHGGHVIRWPAGHHEIAEV